MFTYFISLAILLSSLTACNDKPGVGPETPEKPDTSDPELTLSLEGNRSKSGWEAGDKVVLHDSKSSIVVVLSAADISSDGVTAKVKAVGLDKANAMDGCIHAAYPAENWGEVTHSLMYYLYFKDADGSQPMSVAYSEDNMMAFRSICGTLAFESDGSCDSYSLKGNKGEVLGYGSFYVKDDSDDEGAFSIKDAASPVKEVSGSLKAGRNLIHFPGGVEFKDGFVVEFLKDGAVAQRHEMSGAIKIAAGKLLDVKDFQGDIPEDVYHPIMGTNTAYDVEVPEISGICFTKDKSALWAVGDEGYLYKVSFSGSCEKVWEYGADMEGVTIDPATGDLYLAIEGEQVVSRIAAPGYNSYEELFPIQEAIDDDYGNSGLEGISWYKDNTLFVGSQENANLWTCTTAGKILSKVSLKDVTKDIKEVAGICYDPATDYLWISDSKAKKIFIFTPDGKELIASYNVSFIDNAESLCVDHVHSCVWVGSDEKSPKLYKINFSEL